MCFADIMDDGPRVYRETNPKARKQHNCCECSRKIQPGEHYIRIFGVWVCEAETYKMCERCYSVHEAINRDPTLGQTTLGNLRCCLREHNREKRACQRSEQRRKELAQL